MVGDDACEAIVVGRYLLQRLDRGRAEARRPLRDLVRRGPVRFGEDHVETDRDRSHAAQLEDQLPHGPA